MAYRIKPHCTVVHEVRRIAREQIDKALAELDDPAMDPHEQVHQVRKRCKKIRGLLRLVRPALGDSYAHENRFYRDAARELSDVRDAQTVLETLDKLARHHSEAFKQGAFDAVRQALVARRDRVAEDQADLHERLAQFRKRMQSGRSRIDNWCLNKQGHAAIAGGLNKTYKRGRKALPRAYASGKSEDFHEWRKRVKYHWYHMRLLRGLWPPLIGRRAKALDELSDLLGDDHDLAVLAQTLGSGPDELAGMDMPEGLFDLIEQRRRQLQHEAYGLGTRLYCDKPKALRKRFACYWDIWQQG